MPIDVPILDPHIHLWHPTETPRQVTPLVRLLGWNRWLLHRVGRWAFPADTWAFYGTPEHVTRPYLPADYDADTAHHSVVGAVHVQAEWKGRGPMAAVDETRWLDGLTAVGAGRVEAIVGKADLSLGADIAPVLDAHLAASARFRGVRDMVAWHPNRRVHNLASRPGMLDDPAWRAGFAEVAARGLSFEATCYPHQLGAIAALAEAFPDVTIVLCHLAMPVAIGGPFAGLGETAVARTALREDWQEAIVRVAAAPNVVAKLSGLGMPVLGFGFERAAAPPSFEDAAEAFAPLIGFMIETFGVERCMFASNFPVDKASLPFALLYDVFDAVTEGLGREDRAALFGGNARRVYRIALS